MTSKTCLCTESCLEPAKYESRNDMQQTRLRRAWMVLVLGTLSAFAPLSLDMYLPALPTLATDLHTSTSMAQLSLTFCLLGLAVGQLFVGPMSDMLGRRWPLLIGLAVYTIVSFLCAITSSVWFLQLLRLAQGLAGAAGIVIARAIVRDYYTGTELTRFFALLMLVNGVAPILAPIFGGQLLRVTNWHGIFVVLGMIGVILMVAVIVGLPESLPKQQRLSGGVTKTFTRMVGLFKDRMFMGYSLSQGFVMAAMFGYISGSPFVIQKMFDVSPQIFSLIFAINGIGIIIASQISARLSMNVGEKKVLISGLLLAGVSSLVLFAFIQSGAKLLWILPPLFLVVASVGVVTTTGSSLAMQEQGQNAGSAAAVIGISQLLMGALASPLVGLGGMQTAFPMGLIIASCDVGSILFYIILIRPSFRIRK